MTTDVITHPGQVTVDLDAIASNVAELARRAGRHGAATMAVVKANGYGHGLIPSARAAVAGGADWLGVAQVSEALALRDAGVCAPLLAWLYGPQADLSPAVRRGIDLSAADGRALAQIAAAAGRAGAPARVHLKIDTGLGRNGSPPAQWPDVVCAARKAQDTGSIAVVGVWSHLAWADSPAHPTVGQQQRVFDEAVQQARVAGLDPELCHLANSAATLTNPAMHYDLVRPGLAVFGLSPVPDLGGPGDYGLRPAMSVTSAVSLIKRVPAGQGVSYGHEYHTSQDTTLALVPMGYGDGVPRSASNSGPVSLGGRRFTIAGRVCMDQIMLDIGDLQVDPLTTPAVLLGAGPGEPTAQDWAQAAGTISYEIVTRIAPNLPRRYVGAEAAAWTA